MRDIPTRRVLRTRFPIYSLPSHPSSERNMLTDRENCFGIALPGTVSILLTLIVVWRRSPHALPAVVGSAFMVGYWLLRQPELPPQDGSDWLFWMALPLGAGGILFQRMGPRWAALGTLSGAVVYVVLHPITPAIGSAAVWGSSALAALWGIAAAITLPWAACRIGAMCTVLALSVAIAGTSVVVLSSNYRAYGVNGLGARRRSHLRRWELDGCQDSAIVTIQPRFAVFP